MRSIVDNVKFKFMATCEKIDKFGHLNNSILMK